MDGLNNAGLPNWFGRLVFIVWIIFLIFCLLTVPRKVEAKNLNQSIEIVNLKTKGENSK